MYKSGKQLVLAEAEGHQSSASQTRLWRSQEGLSCSSSTHSADGRLAATHTRENRRKRSGPGAPHDHTDIEFTRAVDSTAWPKETGGKGQSCTERRQAASGIHERVTAVNNSRALKPKNLNAEPCDSPETLGLKQSCSPLESDLPLRRPPRGARS
ncbi:unnamed protein product [Prorocentrum cordatum]|uniref:Uncharacterized protein n=1 Tax=Prorocentrum cordatum TaxID=2364126 RepID=A0ABN9UN11_9DINO|nr:unnamed protein product [Polarella glacialis]